MDKEYLGDGVYVEHDGYQITLSTVPGGGHDTIYLEPEVFNALIRYRANLLARVKAAQADQTIQ